MSTAENKNRITTKRGPRYKSTIAEASTSRWSSHEYESGSIQPVFLEKILPALAISLPIDTFVSNQMLSLEDNLRPIPRQHCR